ncbi:MAG: neutral/alkaline non-lysosomal ceramidase N-terminal domain-containing protein [Planctomycetota bacterium]|jgi:putative membrane-bound dehydrogenase-like protein
MNPSMKSLGLQQLFAGCLVLGMMAWWSEPLTAQQATWRAGVAKTDITPETPVRLSGYASRNKPFTSIADRLYARALVLEPTTAAEGPSPAESQPLVIVSIDAIGISSVMTEQILAEVLPKLNIPRSRIVLCTTHAHTAPHLDATIPNLFASPLEGKERDDMLQYTDRLRREIVSVILKASENRRSASVEYGLGHADFAINRRQLKDKKWTNIGVVEEGPVDRSVRVLRVADEQGKPIAVAYQYACHSTSISPEDNRISGDWPGISATHLESEMAGCIALPIIGCGADSNPNPRGTLELSQAHGKAMATAVQEVLRQPLKPLPPPAKTAFALVALAPERPNKKKLQEMRETGSAHERNFANHWLDLLTRKDRIPETYPAPIHLWAFGSDLAWVFMSGEVVVDYQIRFEKELSQFANVWVAGYVDDVFAYVASERVRGEGGYEVDGSMLYYLQPGRWSSGTEATIVDRVLQMTRQKRLADEPMSPQESLASIQVPEGFTIELMASEPMIMDPVNFAFGTDGTVWVVEMGDYPSGGGRSGCIKALRDTDGDGQLDQAKTFLDQLNYPAGIYPWRDGVVIACAPDIFFARDTNGDGVADERRVLLTGFPEGNPQHRVHGFTYGMEHRLYFGTGGAAERITATGDGIIKKSDPVVHTVSGFDISLDPDTATMRVETGDSQYIRATDDFATWFGHENSYPMYHYVVDQKWANYGGKVPYRRFHWMTDPPSIPPVYPISQQADRFNDLFTINRFTSACSTIINRGPGQGESMRGWATVCEPVHNLVARFRLEPRGATWAAVRVSEDAKSDWVRSSDPWFRPVRIENAPDGTLWIADMYRFVIEHPEWIPEEWQRRINVRAGDHAGRLYRVRQTGFAPMPLVNMTKLADVEIAKYLAAVSSAQADQAEQELVRRQRDGGLPSDAIQQMRRLANEDPEPRVRFRAFATLCACGLASAEDFENRLRDADPRVAEGAVRWIDRAADSASLRSKLWQLVRPEHWQNFASVALAMAIEGSIDTAPRTDAIARALILHANDPWILDMTSMLAPRSIDGTIRSLLDPANPALAKSGPGGQRLLEKLVGRISPDLRNELLTSISKSSGARPAWHYVLARQFAASESSGIDASALNQVISDAKKSLSDPQQATPVASAAIDLLETRIGESWSELHQLFLAGLKQNRDAEIDRKLALALARSGSPALANLSNAWNDLSTDAQSVILTEWTNRIESVPMLLDSVRDGKIPRDSIDAVTAMRLRQLPESPASKMVLELFGPPPGSDRAAIVREMVANWPSHSDQEVGRAAYQKHCAVCHDPRTVDGRTQESVGPNIRGLIHWTNEAWVTAILDPHRSVEEKYWAFQAKTEDGEVITGLKLREDDSAIEWVNTAGRVERTPKSELTEFRMSKLSLMPEGFEQLVAPESLAGIISYLRAESQ